DACGEAKRAADAARALHARLDAVRRRVASAAPVRALVATSDSGLDVAGPGTYLDDLLTLAGGKNAAAPFPKRYVSLDPETLAALAPQVVIQLLPGASPQVEAQARRTWDGIPDLPAVRNRRVVILKQAYAELPGYEVGELAECFAEALHPNSTQSPT